MLPLALVLFLVVSSFATSALSAVLGMAGGMILMALLPLALSVPAAMIAHGAIQAFANGFRAWLLRDAVDRRILAQGAAGSLVAFALLCVMASLVSFAPEKAYVYLGLGALPFVRFLPHSAGLLRI